MLRDGHESVAVHDEVHGFACTYPGALTPSDNHAGRHDRRPSMTAREPRRLPQDPEIRELVQLARALMSRRNVLAGAAGIAGMSALLAACGTGGGTGAAASSGPQPAQDVSEAEKVVKWANWALYLDYD